MWMFISRLLKLGKLREINTRFGRGSVKLSRPQRALLFALRIYLIVMILLLVCKFAQILSRGTL